MRKPGYKIKETNEALKIYNARQIYDVTCALIEQKKDPSPEAVCEAIGAPLQLARRLRLTTVRGPKLLEAYTLARNGRRWPDNLDELTDKTPRECDAFLTRLQKLPHLSEEISASLARLKQLGRERGWGILNKYDLLVLAHECERADQVVAPETAANKEPDEKVEDFVPQESDPVVESPEPKESGEIVVPQAKKEETPPEPPEPRESGLAQISTLSQRVESVRDKLRIVASQPWTKRVAADIDALTLRIAIYSDTAEELKDRCESNLLMRADITMLNQEAAGIEETFRFIVHPKGN